MSILLFGPPGVGKGTQSELLSKNLKMKHISSGDLFRKAVKEKTQLGLKAKSYLDSGKLVPDEIVIGMIGEVFGDLKGQEFILDGFPRTTPQAEALEALMEEKNVSAKKAVFLHVEQAALFRRLTGRRSCPSCNAVYHIDSKPPKKDGVCDSCGANIIQRSDDNPDVIGTRLEAYERSTSPLKEYYKKKNRFVEVNGAGEVNEVFERILGAIS